MYHIVLSIDEKKSMFHYPSFMDDKDPDQIPNSQNQVIDNVESTTPNILRFVRNGVDCADLLCDVHFFRGDTSFHSNVFMHTTVLCAIAVPSDMSMDDFLDFICPYTNTISCVRFLRTGNAEYYGVLIECKNEDYCNSLYSYINGAVFPYQNNKICHLVFVDSINYHKKITQDTQIDVDNASVIPVDIRTFNSVYSSSTSAFVLLRDLYPNIHELPPCCICLERMDTAITCLAVTFCGHVYHCDCISQWTNPHCPICKCLQGKETHTVCSVCGCLNDLWICAICGYIGCSRYKGGHAYQHYIDTKHVYTIEIETQSIWDYSQDRYIHRLIRNQSDGKIIALPSTDEVVEENYRMSKKEMIQAEEFEKLCIVQLDSQKSFYDNQIQTLLREKETIQKKYENSNNESITLRSEMNRISDILKENTSKIETTYAQMEQYRKKYDEIQKNNTHMNKRIKELELRVKTMESVHKYELDNKDKIIQELTDTNQDLMRHFDMESKINEPVESITVSCNSIPPPTPSINQFLCKEKEKKKKSK
ncbi:hypothetical protein WA158_005357 [Blastocystis sp. Blastoise]